MRTTYLPLSVLGIRLGLSQSYLRQLVDEGKLPHLRIKGYLRFSEEQAREALRDLAVQEQLERMARPRPLDLCTSPEFGS